MAEAEEFALKGFQDQLEEQLTALKETTTLLHENEGDDELQEVMTEDQNL